jgi:hypothetical protein
LSKNPLQRSGKMIDRPAEHRKPRRGCVWYDTWSRLFDEAEQNI